MIYAPASRRAAIFLVFSSLCSCGTTYDVREINSGQLAAVSSRHATIQAQPKVDRSGEESAAMFTAVKTRIEPIAEEFCSRETTAGTVCDYDILIDPSRKAGNAYQTYIDGTPTLIFTPGFLAAVGNEHELAFVMGHEAGHHIAGHLDKKQTQTTVAGVGGALLGGLLVVAIAAAGGNPSAQDIDALVGGGAAVGAVGGASAYSQTFELEADMIGAYVAEAAGYDPEQGSAVFPRISGDKHAEPESGQAAFWSTHPSSPERLAWAAQVAADIKAARERGEAPKPPRARDLSERIADNLGL